MQELESEWTQKRLHKSTVDAFIISESLLVEKNLFTGKRLYSQYINYTYMFVQDIFINNIIMVYIIAMIIKEIRKKKIYTHCICTFGA